LLERLVAAYKWRRWRSRSPAGARDCCTD